MSDEASGPPAGVSTEPATLEQRVTALEAAVASLGAIHVTQNHDSLAKFRAWLSSYLVKL
jgi:hypothetical protein